jgi:hypothetical protein
MKLTAYLYRVLVLRLRVCGYFHSFVSLWHDQGWLYLYFVSYLMTVSNSHCIASNGWTVMNYELGSVWNGTAVASSKALCWHLSKHWGKTMEKFSEDSLCRRLILKLVRYELGLLPEPTCLCFGDVLWIFEKWIMHVWHAYMADFCYISIIHSCHKDTFI